MRDTVPEWVTLTEGEEIHWYGRPSVARLARQLAVPVVITLVGLAVLIAEPVGAFGTALEDVPFVSRGLTIVGLIVLIAGLALSALVYLRHAATGYVLTSEELYVKRGLVSRSVTNVRLERVQDTGFTQSWLQRLLGYGDVTVSTAGGGGVELRFEDVDDPADVNSRISRQVDDARDRHGGQPATGDRPPTDERAGGAGNGR